MSKREVLGRYRGSILGLAWSFFNPLLMLGVYTFFFSVVFKARWGAGQEAGTTDFAIVLFAGLIVHGLFSECINRAPALIIGNVSYVKKVVFPLEILPWIAMGSAIFHAGVSILVLLCLQWLITGSLHWTVVLFPIVLAPLVVFTIGVAWFLSAMGVFIRDIAQTTGMITSILLFVSPVFYPISMLPARIQTVIMLNPLTLIIEEFRKVLLVGELPSWPALAVYLGVSLAAASGGFWFFQRTRKGFADVL